MSDINSPAAGASYLLISSISTYNLQVWGIVLCEEEVQGMPSQEIYKVVFGEFWTHYNNTIIVMTQKPYFGGWVA